MDIKKLEKMSKILIILAVILLALGGLALYLGNMNAFMTALIASVLLSSMGCSAAEYVYRHKPRK